MKQTLLRAVRNCFKNKLMVIGIAAMTLAVIVSNPARGMKAGFGYCIGLAIVYVSLIKRK